LERNAGASIFKVPQKTLLRLEELQQDVMTRKVAFYVEGMSLFSNFSHHMPFSCGVLFYKLASALQALPPNVYFDICGVSLWPLQDVAMD
jgi:hypothetical protein